MPYLLDTHVLLWSLDEEKYLSAKAKTIITDLESDCFISIVSYYEMAIKAKIGKLELVKSISEYIHETERIGISVLPISSNSLDSYHAIPLIPGHGDPFDRLILATALAEHYSIISADEKFEQYKSIVEVIW